MTTPTQQWSDWIAHDGSECPIPWAKGGEYRIRFSNGEEGLATELDDADTWGWAHFGHEYDIAFYSHIIRPTEAEAEGAPLQFSYRNYRGEVSERTVTPLGVRFGSTEWHPEPQWLLRAYDHGKGAEREFAMSDIGASPSLVEAAEAMAAALDRLLKAMRDRPVSPVGSESIVDNPPYGKVVSDAQIALALYRTTSKEG